MKVYIDKEFQELIPIFIANHEKLMEALDKAIHEEDAEALAFLGHRMAGTAENYGFSDLGKMARAIESLALKKAVENARHYWNEMNQYMTTLEIEYIEL